jgi:hypothetical protein
MENIEYQSTITDWINTSKIDKPPKIFFLNWGKHKSPKCLCPKWLHKMPNECNFKTKIYWREYKMNLIVAGYFNPNHIDYSFTNEYVTDNYHVLKSHLQKCIRRKLTEKSIQTAYQLINCNFNQFLRRLTIIIPEDDCLRYYYSIIVWLMVANSSKKYIPKKCVIEWLLGLIYVISENKFTDIPQKSFQYSNESLNNLSTCNKHFLYSIKLRKSYGGMKGDMRMLIYLYNTWLFRLNNNETMWENFLNVKIRRISLSIKLLKANEFELSCVDFHCYPNMLLNINKVYRRFSPEEIKKAIWYNRSSINYRKKYDFIKSFPDNDDNRYTYIWKLIENYVTNYSLFILNHLKIQSILD